MEKKTVDVSAMNIYEKLLHIQSEIPTVAKNLNVVAGYNQSYKAVSERDVKDAIKPLEEKYGVYSYPIMKELIDQRQIEQEGKNGKRTVFYIREKVTYRFVNIHKPEEFIEIDGYGDGIDTGDKSTGKADTYASKYCLLSAYKISTGDDPDVEASPEHGYKKEPQKKQEAPKQTAPKKKQDMSDVSKMAVEMTRLVGELKKIDIDIHNEAVSTYVMQKANVNTVDGGLLLNDPPAMTRVIAVLGAILNSKKS